MGEIMSMHMWKERRREIRADTKKIIGQIVGRYKSAYTYYLLQRLRNNISGNNEQQMLLSQRKWKSYNRPLQSGALYVLGGSDTQKWRRRFCVLQADYTLEVYDCEEDFEASNKPRFSQKYSSFKVADNVDAHLNQSIKDYLRDFGYVTQNVSNVIKQLGSPVDASKRPTQHVLALTHPYRGAFYMAADTAVEKEKWLNSVQDAARQLAGIHCEDEIECKAFEFAINKSCDAEEHCGINCDPSGTQEQVTTDFITDYLASGCKTMLQTKVKGNLIKKYKMWSMISKRLALLVESIVEVEYPPLRKRAEEEANELKPKMMASMPQISTAYENISFEIIAALDPSLKPELEKMILPRLPELTSNMADAMTSCLQNVRDILVSLAEGVKTRVNTTTPQFANNIDRYFVDHLDLAPRNPEVMRSTFQAIMGPKSPLKAVAEMFPKFQYATHQNELCVQLQRLLDSCIYTFEMLCGESVQKENGQLQVTTIAKIHRRVLKKLAHDVLLVSKQFIQGVVLEVTLKIVRYSIDTVAKEKIIEFEDLVPVEYTEFMPIANVFKDTVSDKLLKEIEPATFKALANDHFSMARYQSSSTIDSRSSAFSNTSDEIPATNKNDIITTISYHASPVHKIHTVSQTNGGAENQVEVHLDSEGNVDEKTDESSQETENESSNHLDENGEVIQGVACMDGETGEYFKCDKMEDSQHHLTSDKQDEVLKDATGEQKLDAKENKNHLSSGELQNGSVDKDPIQNGKVGTRSEEDEDLGPPTPTPRKNRSPAGAPDSNHHGDSDSRAQNNNDILRSNLADADIEKYSGVVGQIIHTGEEKLI